MTFVVWVLVEGGWEYAFFLLLLLWLHLSVDKICKKDFFFFFFFSSFFLFLSNNGRSRFSEFLSGFLGLDTKIGREMVFWAIILRCFSNWGCALTHDDKMWERSFFLGRPKVGARDRGRSALGNGIKVRCKAQPLKKTLLCDELGAI